MKNAPITKSNESTKNHFHYTGQLPERKSTVTADVLAYLLEGKTITGMDAVFGQHTTRAAAFIHTLESRYGWTIDRQDVATGTNDGRIAWITSYWLSKGARETAFKAGARPWVEQVKAARAKLRTTAPKRKAEAARINKARKPITTRNTPRQFTLWGDL